MLSHILFFTIVLCLLTEVKTFFSVIQLPTKITITLINNYYILFLFRFAPKFHFRFLIVFAFYFTDFTFPYNVKWFVLFLMHYVCMVCVGCYLWVTDCVCVHAFVYCVTAATVAAVGFPAAAAAAAVVVWQARFVSSSWIRCSIR